MDRIPWLLFKIILFALVVVVVTVSTGLYLRSHQATATSDASVAQLENSDEAYEDLQTSETWKNHVWVVEVLVLLVAAVVTFRSDLRAVLLPW